MNKPVNKSVLTIEQKKILAILRPSLRNAVRLCDLESAKEILHTIQKLLRNTGHETMLQQYKLWYFEAELSVGNFEYAKTGFLGVKKKTSQGTKVNLEATALLAVCHLRLGEVSEAEPLMTTVLKNRKIIKSDSNRRIFQKAVIERFEEECAIAAYRGKYSDKLDAMEIQQIAGELVQRMNEDELFSEIGKYAHPDIKNVILRINDFARNQLTSSDRRLLANPADRVKDEQVGRTIFRSFKHTLWKSLCDPKSQVYKMWCEKTMDVLYSKGYYATILVAYLADVGVAHKLIAAPVLALLLRFGLDVYCDRYKPEGIVI